MAGANFTTTEAYRISKMSDQEKMRYFQEQMVSQGITTYTPDPPANSSRDDNSNKEVYRYDPYKKGWVLSNNNNKEDTNSKEDSTPTETTPDTPDTPDTPTTQVDSKKEAEKEYIEIELNTLVGDVALIPTKKSIRIEVNNTVSISGVGNYLSGNYFVSSVKRSISKDSGYSQSITVIKNGFGDSLKKSPNETKPREEAVEKSASDIKVGDKVKIVAENAVYSNAHEGVKVPAWVKQKTLTVRQISSDGSRALLMPILSWTYIKYIQKV